MIILGVNLTTHDSGAAIIKDGKILAVVNEERLSRIKMDGSAPRRSIAKVLTITGIKEQDINVLAFSDMPNGLRRYFYFFWQQNQRVWYTGLLYLRSFLSLRTFSLGRLLNQTGMNGLKLAWRSARETRAIIKNLKKGGFRGVVKLIPHDLAHATGAYYTSGMNDALVGVLEGSSFTNTASFWKFIDGKLKKVMEISLPHSAGRYYEVVTQILGFHPKKHGGKITGLAALGNSKKCYGRVAELFYMKDGRMRVAPQLYALHDEYFARGRKLPKLFIGETKEDIAAAFQKRLEDVIVEQFNELSKNHSIKNLALSGGVFANVKLNMEIANLPKVEKIFIHPGMGDVGQALGSALAAYSEQNKNFKPFRLRDVYFGPDYSDAEIESALQARGLKFSKESDIGKKVGALLAKNKVIGFFQGRMEYGPRALGNRTIMYPATDPKVNDWLNKQLNRTEFMPFAPVTLAERADDCYRNLDKCRYAAEFMTITVPVSNYMAKYMPAAVHVDGTARPQIIDRETNRVYYDTIKEYERLTGLPTVINTSFNMHEEPIVCAPEEAISAYEQSGLDALAIGDHLVLKNEQ